MLGPAPVIATIDGGEDCNCAIDAAVPTVDGGRMFDDPDCPAAAVGREGPAVYA